jgi:hypothetical protein
VVKREAVELGLGWEVDMVYFDGWLVVGALGVDGLVLVVDGRVDFVGAGHDGLYVALPIVFYG